MPILKSDIYTWLHVKDKDKKRTTISMIQLWLTIFQILQNSPAFSGTLAHIAVTHVKRIFLSVLTARIFVIPLNTDSVPNKKLT